MTQTSETSKTRKHQETVSDGKYFPKHRKAKKNTALNGDFSTKTLTFREPANEWSGGEHKQYKMFSFCHTCTSRKSGKSTSAWEYLLPVLTYTTRCLTLTRSQFLTNWMSCNFSVWMWPQIRMWKFPEFQCQLVKRPVCHKEPGNNPKVRIVLEYHV